MESDDRYRACYEQAKKLGMGDAEATEIAGLAVNEWPNDTPVRYEPKAEMPERGPWSHPPTRIQAAVTRLKDLRERAAKMDEGEVIAAISDIAREFDAAGLKQVAAELGITKAIPTKASMVRQIAEYVSGE